VSYQTAWLKTHHPAEFMAAVLSSDMDNTDKVVGFLDEARALGLTVLPPDVNASRYMFEAIDARTIRYGLGAVKGVGRGACDAIAEERARGGAFADLLEFSKRVDSAKLNRRALEALVNAGAMDGLGRNRPSLMLQLPEVLKATEQLAREREAGQNSLFGGLPSGDAASTHGLRIELPDADDWPLLQKLQGERDTLGHYLSGHPLDPYRDELRALVGHDLGDLDRLWNERPEDERRGWRQEATVIVAGLVIGMRKRGDSQAFVQLEDGRGRIECAFFAEPYHQFAQLLTRDRILLVEGGLREDEFSGGFSLRARRCWDYVQVCAQQAQRLSVKLDLRERDALGHFAKVLKAHHGATPLLLEAITGSAVGRLSINGGQGVRVDAALPGLLRSLPGVRAVRLSLAKPWAG
jgi:DNA polymerase-3 subunit alpha